MTARETALEALERVCKEGLPSEVIEAARLILEHDVEHRDVMPDNITIAPFTIIPHPSQVPPDPNTVIVTW